MRKYLRMGIQAGPYILFAMGKIRKYAKNPEKYSVEERHAEGRKFLGTVNRLGLHATYIITGQENLPPQDQQCIFYGNHASLIDAVTLPQIADRPMGILAKKEVIEMPFVGTCAKSIDCLFMDREDLRSEIKLMMQLADLLKTHPDLSYVIFPEGTRSEGPDFNLGPFHAGSFKVAMRGNYPIVPFCFYLTDRVLSQHYHYKKYPVQISYLKPIYPEEYENMTTQQVADMVKERIAAELEVLKSRDRELVKTLNGFSDKKTDKVLHYIPTEEEKEKKRKKKAKKAAKKAKKEEKAKAKKKAEKK